jgi:hypothetical protein
VTLRLPPGPRKNPTSAPLAVLYRMIDKKHPTLFFDEVDAVFIKKKPLFRTWRMPSVESLFTGGTRRYGGASRQTTIPVATLDRVSVRCCRRPVRVG